MNGGYFAPLVLHAADSGKVDRQEFFLLKLSTSTAGESVVFPIPMALLRRFVLLQNLVENDGDEERPTTIHIFDVPPAIGSRQTVELLTKYCRLRHRTQHEALPRDTTRFASSITSDEASFLQQELPLTTHLKSAFECLKIADYLQFHDLRLLVSGHIATGLAGKSTAEMRHFLGIETSDPRVLFSQETREMIELEEQWLS